MSDIKPISVRKQLYLNGYTPLANRDKACYLERWPNIHVDLDQIQHWDRMRKFPATGVRVENGLCVIDIDINHRVMDDVCTAMLKTLPKDKQPERLERGGKGYKIAWFCRTAELFTRLHTRKWTAPGAGADDETHCVEIFGGATPRQFGAYGPHSHKPDGDVAVTYQWADESLVDVPFHALDVLTKQELFAMLDAAEAELRCQGFEPVPLSVIGESVAGRVYDLDDHMSFDLLGGDTVSFLEIKNMVKRGYTGRCSASFIEGDKAVNRSRCLVSATNAGFVSIWETSEGVTHLPVSVAPRGKNVELDRAAERMKKTLTEEGSKLVPGEDPNISGAKLLNAFAFMPRGNSKPVVPIWARSPDEAITLANFRTQFSPFAAEELGPRGGVKRVNPVDVWVNHTDRITIEGLRMRPDRPCPVYEEKGEKFINTYEAPNLGTSEGGSPEIGMGFLKQLLPSVRERRWFTQWLAYKWRNPHVPGPAVIMIAKEFGTGRGTFKTLLKKMFGERYVPSIPFRIYAGANYQSQYNDWGLGALIAVVDESSNGREGSQYQARHEIYEQLKELVDPRPIERMYVKKGEQSISAISSMSSLIYSNNSDTIPLPADDRRFAVLTNGRPRNLRYWTELNEWLERPENIAAFAEWLEAVDLEDYDPFDMPISTTAKADMVEQSRSTLDESVHQFIKQAGDYFTINHLNDFMADRIFALNLDLPKSWRELALRTMRSKCYTVRYPNGRTFEPSIKGKRLAVFTFDYALATYEGTGKELRSEVIKSGDVFGISRERLDDLNNDKVVHITKKKL